MIYCVPKLSMKAAFVPIILFLSFNGSAQFEKANWISPGFAEDSMIRPCPIFKKEFTANKVIQSAMVYITAHGLYEAELNGKRIGKAYFTPGWTSYNRRLQYQEYEVKDLLKKGSNKVFVTIGDGWYRGVFGGDMNNNNYGKDASLIFQFNIVYTDGSKQIIMSDKSW